MSFSTKTQTLVSTNKLVFCATIKMSPEKVSPVSNWQRLKYAIDYYCK
jgi:hypothetical protein